MEQRKAPKPVIGISTDVDGDHLRLHRAYCEAVEAAGGIPLLLPPMPVAEAYAAIVQGVLIPGGRDLDPCYYREEVHPRTRSVSRARSDFEMSLITCALKLNKPVFGICYGMQLLNVFFGGSLYQDIASQLSVAINHEKDYHNIVIAENRFLAPGTFSVNSSHHQVVRILGNGLSAIARSDDQIIEALCGEDYHFLVGVQWHPERDPDDKISGDIFRQFIQASRIT